jgi:hypothetical protein
MSIAAVQSAPRCARLDPWASLRAVLARRPSPHEPRGSIIFARKVLEGIMDGWKRAVVAGSVGAATILFLKKKYPAGVMAGGVALAVLASEFPEKFEKVRRSLPDYFDRGMQVMEMAARAGKRITDAAGRSAYDAWEEVGG